jgi:pyruvate dehydrogenase E2 component (dihydrolipoamide acetyltransferase)
MRDADASAFNEAREKLAAQVERSHGARLTHTDLLVSLVARVLLKHPRINASWEADGVRPNTQINVSVAIAVEDGVVAPVIHSANEMALDEIAIRRRDLVDRARSGKLRPQDITGGTFTISNLGMFGVDAFMAIITAPQAAILAVGKIRERVVAVNGQCAIRPIMTLTLSTDHRVANGAAAAKFLRDVAEAISDPYHLLAAGS